MGSVSQEKLEVMLKIYREKLAKAETAPLDYALCLRLSAQVSLLEDLWFLARQSAAQHSVKPTISNVGDLLKDGSRGKDYKKYK